MSNRVAIIGAGLAGISIACLINKKFDTEIFEKSRGIGGRMSTRNASPFNFDHGAQYFKIKSKEFMNFATNLIEKEVIKTWSFRHAFFNENNLEKLKMITDKDKYYVGAPNMNSIIHYLSKGFKINLNTKINKIIKKNNKWCLYDEDKKTFSEFNWVILCLPAEQALNLIYEKIYFYNLLKHIKMRGCFSLLIGRDKDLSLNFDAAYIQNNDIVWIASNNSKPNRNNNHSLIINSSYDYAKKNINTSREVVINHMLNLINKLTKKDLSNSALISLHQWRYAEAENNPVQNYFIDENEKIAVCGDWFINSRVEDAFTSAHELSKEIMKQ